MNVSPLRSVSTEYSLIVFCFAALCSFTDTEIFLYFELSTLFNAFSSIALCINLRFAGRDGQRALIVVSAIADRLVSE